MRTRTLAWKMKRKNSEDEDVVAVVRRARGITTHMDPALSEHTGFGERPSPNKKVISRLLRPGALLVIASLIFN